jgi:methionine biosynthesis protein MetW
VVPVTTPAATAAATPQREHYDAIWARKTGGAPVEPIRPGTRIDMAARFIGTGITLIDIGCGRGALAALVRGRFARVVGLELSAIAAAQARDGGLCPVLADLDRATLPVRDASADAVTCLDVIEHVLDPRALMREIARVLAPGGRAVVTTPNIQFWRHIWSIVRGRFPRTSTDSEGWDGGHLHYFTFGDLEQLAADCGLAVEHRHGIINAERYGLKNRALVALLGERFVREYRTFGILLVLRRRTGTPA